VFLFRHRIAAWPLAHLDPPYLPTSSSCRR